MTLSYIVLGEYHPSRWRASIIGPELCEITRGFGFKPHVSPPMLAIQQRASWKSDELHACVTRFAVPEREGSSWHQDGDHAPGADMNCGIILWCGRDPTEIRWKNEVRQLPVMHVVWFHNLSVYHRRPPDVSGKRWLFRQRVQKEEIWVG